MRFQKAMLYRVVSALALGTFLPLWTGTGALADDHWYPATNRTWKAECGSCHVAYPPQLLPASSWQTLMSSLARHFGTDASIDPRTNSEISGFLVQNAGSRWRLLPAFIAEEPPLRITETSWFTRKHRKVRAATWRRPEVKSAANCSACHIDAEAGNFSERGVRVSP